MTALAKQLAGSVAYPDEDVDYADEDIEYPDEDGEGMPEGDVQRDYVHYSTKALRLHYRHRPDIYVSGNLFIYYEEGNPRACIAPDTFIVFGIENHDRNTYKVWKEGGKTPDFALEITSHSTVQKDKRDKVNLYQQLNIQEYFQYDPTGSYLKPVSLLGYQLVAGIYNPMPTQILPSGVLSIYSEVLQLELRLLPEGLRFYDPLGDCYLLTQEESEQARLQAEQARLQAEQLAQRLADRLRAMGIDPDTV
jgi:Uma2 family endonuclease